MPSVRYDTIDENTAGQRLDNYLLRVLKGVPKSHIYRIIRNGEVRINSKRAQVSSRLMSEDKVRIPPVTVSAPDSETINVGKGLVELLKNSILFEDKCLLVLNKPAGLAVHGGSGLSLGVIEALRKIREDLPYLELIHRLDKETSGCLLLAKKRSFLRKVQALLMARTVQKTYWALLSNSWTGSSPRIVNVALEKSILQSNERIVAVKESGKPSCTRFNLLENYTNLCWVEAKPETGRTHQIRVHSAHLGHPIVGDEKYGNKQEKPTTSDLPSRLYLHARAIQFTLDGKSYLFEADLEPRFQTALKRLRTGAAKKNE